MSEKSNREPTNVEHTGGGEQNRRKQKSDDPRIEKNPPRDREGRTASEQRPGAPGSDGAQRER